MSNTKRYYIPRHAHAKAIAHFCKEHETGTYPLREINGVHGGLVKTTDRKRPVAGIRVWFQVGHILRFERTF